MRASSWAPSHVAGNKADGEDALQIEPPPSWVVLIYNANRQFALAETKSGPLPIVFHLHSPARVEERFECAPGTTAIGLLAAGPIFVEGKWRRFFAGSCYSSAMAEHGNGMSHAELYLVFDSDTVRETSAFIARSPLRSQRSALATLRFATLRPL